MAAVPESSLEDGLTALEQSDFNKAIAILEAVCQNPSQSTATKIQAQQGLVAAYLAIKEDKQGILLLQALNQSGDPQVRAWVARNYPQFVPPPNRRNRICSL